MNTLSKDAQAYKLALRIACEKLSEATGENSDKLFSDLFDQASRLVVAASNEVA